MASNMGKLSEDATKAAIACGVAVQLLPYQPYESYEICDDTTSMVNVSQDFFKYFVPSFKTKKSPTRFIAVRFENPATIPVKAGSSIQLIPVHIISGTPSVADVKLRLGDYIHLTTDALVEPAFYCLLLLAQ